ncbi:MAG: hypothetical protein DSY74_01715 [Actinobacteria bacterium]|jgi:hypothetical protein|nr:hypothetical protein [Micrococcales bacterium]RUA27463.1 MAG: hypothetical protein DSY74_01715 [Actinomycetota bacterium]HIE60848.1 hypothetical protein [Microbacterium sp.]|tara:strand:+ start:330 stop:821 length:492 start_codon:yes stop_codon:yes gene_type:complete
MRGRSVGAIFAVAITALALTGCTPTPVDDAAAQAWIDATNADLSTRATFLGPSSGMRSAAGPEATEPVEVLTFAEPYPTVAEMLVGCFGTPGQHATVGWMPRSASNWSGGGGAEIPCDGTLVSVASAPEPQPSVNAISLAITWDGEPGYYYAAFLAPSDASQE